MPSELSYFAAFFFKLVCSQIHFFVAFLDQLSDLNTFPLERDLKPVYFFMSITQRSFCCCAKVF
ncbi:hypothetical protein AX767_09670 [Variovorax sp. PAMC 28711]|nr:hypothetical protein AX767_09670 [Variovorax sp. PAMC 28711]